MPSDDSDNEKLLSAGPTRGKKRQGKLPKKEPVKKSRFVKDTSETYASSSDEGLRIDHPDSDSEDEDQVKKNVNNKKSAGTLSSASSKKKAKKEESTSEDSDEKPLVKTKSKTGKKPSGRKVESGSKGSVKTVKPAKANGKALPLKKNSNPPKKKGKKQEDPPDESDDEPLMKGEPKNGDDGQKDSAGKMEESVEKSSGSEGSGDEGLKIDASLDDTEKVAGEDEMRKKVADMLESSSESDKDAAGNEEEEHSESHGVSEEQKPDEDEVEEKEKSEDHKSDAKKKSEESSSSDDAETLAILRADKPDEASGNKKKTETAEKSKDALERKSSSSSIDDKNDASATTSKKSGVKGKEKSKTDDESSRFKRLRRLAAVAGLRFKYKQLEDVKSESKKYNILKSFMVENGITKFSLEACKAYRQRKEEQAEVAELSKNQIFGADSSKRVTRGVSRKQEQQAIAQRKAHLSTSSSDNASEREEMIEENQRIFSRLKGIVSDESD